jgi:hypothetical protein
MESTGVQGLAMSWVTDPKFFPSLMIALSIASCVRYAMADDLGKCCYWGSAAAITFSVTYMMK